ncbi:hypothetical protein NV379_14470 [Paenibacillus sp. N1-5-1-14]|uniref:DUF6773 family protein n=1 Tax=Paenibacillus radicibacter TaxID=2972488 RepID=UPI0021594D9B|nr:DUF6773 family protein [Paenibacillus radicibacter]MCR8643857.1 hypothetical protein [Paenibacillus radicibacter]
MKRMKDERLELQTLKNIRVAYIVLMLGVLLILVKQFTEVGTDVFTSPLFFVMIISNAVFTFKNIGVSIDYESTNKKKSFLDSYPNLIGMCVILAIVFGVLNWILTTEPILWEVVLSSTIFSVCFLIPFTIAYRKKKRMQDQDLDD